MNYRERKYPSDTQKANRTIWILGSLLFLSTAFALYFAFVSGSLKSEQTVLSQNISDLNENKSDLELQLSDLDSSYKDQIVANDDLSMTLEQKLEEVKNLQGRVWNAKQKLTASQEENKAINDRLAQLEDLKGQLETDIASLEKTNGSLLEANTKITSDLEMSQKAALALNDELKKKTAQNEALINRLNKIAPAGFVADNFKVTAAKRNSKLTVKARQVDQVSVAFDINDVPTEYRSEEEIYLVLTSFDGTPLEDVESTAIEVASVDPVSLNVVDRKKTVLREHQNVEMTFDVDRDLESGLYNVLVYADHGFLGATTFQLQ